MPKISIELLDKHVKEWKDIVDKLHNGSIHSYLGIMKDTVIGQGFGAYMNKTYNWKDDEVSKLQDISSAYDKIKSKYVQEI